MDAESLLLQMLALNSANSQIEFCLVRFPAHFRPKGCQSLALAFAIQLGQTMNVEGHIAAVPMSESPASPAPSQPTRAAQLFDLERWVDEHGDYLFKYALSRLRNPLKAEDAVQETFLVALKGGKNFEGRSAERFGASGRT
jgi:hypothetical protein